MLAAVITLREPVRHVADRPVGPQIGLLEQRPDVGGGGFAAAGIGQLLHGAAELHLQPARHRDAIAAFQQIGDAALARLAVDANDRIVGAAHVGRVDRQIGHLPDGIRLLHRKAFLDGVLVRARERGEDQVAHVRMARVHRQLRTVFARARHVVDVREVQPRIDALRVQVERQRDQVHVAGALAVAEQAAFHAVGAGHHRQLGRRDRRAAVVVRVHGEEDRIAPRQVAMHPFDLVGVDVGRGHLHRGRQVEDDLVRGRRVPRLGDGVADLQRKVQLGAAEDLRAVLIRPLRLGHRLGDLADQLRALHGDALDAFAVGVEHRAAEHRRGRVVDVDDRAPGAAQRFHGAADQVLARLRQHLDGHVIGDVSAFDQLAHEVVVGLGGGGEGGFDFLEADLHEHLEHAHLALGVHRLEQGLVAVAQVRAHPDRRTGEGLGRPGAIGQGDRRERAVLGGGVLQHGECVL